MKQLLKMALLATTVSFAAGSLAHAQNECAAGKTLEEGVLTIATGNPAYFPWVMNDAPEAGEGFEAAVALEVARRMGFEGDAVKWVRTSFDQAIQPGEKNFDFNLQQYSITEEREKFVDFSQPYYVAAQSVVVRQPTIDAGAKPTVESLKGLIWGAVESSTAPQLIKKLIGEDVTIRLYGDVADSLEAMKANQIDAVLVDLPSALFVTAVQLDDGVILGQFDESEDAPTALGLLFSEGNPLRECADNALTTMKDDGKLAEIETEWLQVATGAPVIE